MDYKRLKRLIGATTVAAGFASIVWIILGREIQGLALIALAGIMLLSGLLHLFAPGEEPEPILQRAIEEAKQADQH